MMRKYEGKDIGKNKERESNIKGVEARKNRGS